MQRPAHYTTSLSCCYFPDKIFCALYYSHIQDVPEPSIFFYQEEEKKYFCPPARKKMLNCG